MGLQHLSLSPAGGKAVTGPKLVTAEQGSSLAVSCSYMPRYKLNSKYWCLKNSLSFCWTYIIQTDGSEVTVTQDRVSIRDNHTANSFTVTLSSVTLRDAGQYSCGVKRKLRINQRHSIKVMVSAGKTGLEAKLALNFPLFPLPPLLCSGCCPDTSISTLCTFIAEVSAETPVQGAGQGAWGSPLCSDSVFSASCFKHN